MENGNNIIHIEGLRKVFTGNGRSVTALDGISLDIRQGEIFGIIGLSGAGKSTLVRCINLIERPTEGTVVQGYSMERLSYNATTRDWRTHPGMDIGAPEGSEVKAVAEGPVLSVFTDDLLGKTVTVEHAGGYVTHYANLAEEVSVSAGDHVIAGQAIGTVGRTALGERKDEPHLHFAVYKNNVPQDPEAYLSGN